MQELIESQIVHDPAITATIRDIKQQIKDYAVSQKEGKKAFRAGTSAWAKGHGVYTDIPRFKDESMTITALLHIYGELRQTKHPHFLTREARLKYYTDLETCSYTHNLRVQVFCEVMKKLVAKNTSPAVLARIADIGKELTK